LVNKDVDDDFKDAEGDGVAGGDEDGGSLQTK